MDSQEAQLVSGILKLPSKTTKNQKFPLIIGVAGSLGWKEHHYDHLKMFREQGFATFELHSFNSRGVKSTVGTQVEVTTAMMILDSYKALDVLSAHKNIDNQNVGIIGWSLGGGTALFSGWEPLINAINSSNKFAAHLSYYPPCIVKPNDLEFTDSPMHILIGEDDDWTPANACKELVDAAKTNKDNIGITIFENSHHSFDSHLPLKFIEKGYSLSDCMFELRNDGVIKTNFLNLPIVSPFWQKIVLGLCAKRGTTIAGNPVSRELSMKFSKSFMSKHLLEK